MYEILDDFFYGNRELIETKAFEAESRNTWGCLWSLVILRIEHDWFCNFQITFLYCLRGEHIFSRGIVWTSESVRSSLFDFCTVWRSSDVCLEWGFIILSSEPQQGFLIVKRWVCCKQEFILLVYLIDWTTHCEYVFLQDHRCNSIHTFTHNFTYIRSKTNEDL